MLVISEWLPNPVGSDTAGEWIELHNAGSESISLAGYRIAASKGKPYVFGAHLVAPDQYVVLPRATSGITLRNQDESLTLTDANGDVVDTVAFVGSAPEGKSFSRNGMSFIFTDPTPGAPNTKPLLASVEANYVLDAPIHPPISSIEWIVIAIAVGIGLSLAVTTIIGRNENLAKLFFERDEEHGEGAR